MSASVGDLACALIQGVATRLDRVAHADLVCRGLHVGMDRPVKPGDDIELRERSVRRRPDLMRNRRKARM
jgi:hypothetical protein